MLESEGDGLLTQRGNTYSCVLVASAGGYLQRFVASLSNQSQGASEKGMVLSAERSPTCCEPPPIGSSPRCSSALPLPSPPPAPPTDGEEKLIKTPGAVQTSQLIPLQAIGCERLSVTVGQAKQSTICSGLVVMRTKAGEGGGAKGRREGVWVERKGVGHGISAEKKKKSPQSLLI
ncbi:hypothetical protein EXN66_Car005143 [Channa argus]|uniref:Uncharacterized protein n=1 Tax=Channa argus TaxID=215402 RepID=A0A6G1PGL8_CHAAH|nr:hypothetical protein EXN66_Car005143 [Channa argus]